MSNNIVNFNQMNGQSSVEIPIEFDVVDKVESLNLSAANTRTHSAGTNRIRRNSLSRSSKSIEAAEADAEHHLLNPESNNGHRPSIAKPELDDDDELDDDEDDNTSSAGNYPGVDSGFFPPSTNNDHGHDTPRRGPPFYTPNNRKPSINGGTPGDIPGPVGGFPTVEFDNPPPGNTINGVHVGDTDFNSYQQRKTIAQGMMDLALLSANANQLRYVLESFNRHPYYYPSIVFISISIIFQIAVGIGLIINGRCSFKKEKEINKANRINNFTVLGIFIVTVVNVFISAFGVADMNPNFNNNNNNNG